MAVYTIQDTTLRDIADVIRDKKDEVLEIEYQMVNSVANTSFNIVEGKKYRLILIPSELIADGEGQLEFSTQTTSGNYAGYFGSGITKYVVGEPMELIFTAPYDGTLMRVVNITKKGSGSKIVSAIVKLAEIKEDGSLANAYKPTEMAAAIDEIMEIPNKALSFTGNCSYGFTRNHWNWFIEQCGDKITAQDISNPSYMFYYSDTLQEIPFSIYLSSSSTSHSTASMFNNCNKLIEIPMIYSLKVSDMSGMFSGCSGISSFPENFAKDWDWSYLETATGAYTGSMANLFTNCMKLREIPQELLIHGNPFWTYSYTLTNAGFNNCCALEKLENVFIPYKSTSLTSSYSNAFNSAVKNCCRLKKLTLQTQQDGTPYNISGWKYQTIDLTTTGYGSITYVRGAGLTEETKIDNEEKWRGYINGSYPDGWADSVEYSTFGATAVKELIASLPNITGGSNNTVKLKQSAASAIPGEEMTSLTEEDIVIATEKGWTITFV